MSKQPIYEAKARYFLAEIGSISQDDTELMQQRFDEFFQVAKLIENPEFLLKLRNMQIADRNVFKRVLEFLTEHISLEVKLLPTSQIITFELSEIYEQFMLTFQI